MSRSGRSFQVGPFHQSLKHIYHGGSANSSSAASAPTSSSHNTNNNSGHNNYHHHHHPQQQQPHQVPHHHPHPHQPLYHHNSRSTQHYVPPPPTTSQQKSYNNNNTYHGQQQQQKTNNVSNVSQKPINSTTHHTTVSSSSSSSSMHNNNNNNNNSHDHHHHQVMFDAYGYPIVPYQPPQPVPFTSNSQPYQPHHHSRTVPHPCYDPPSLRRNNNNNNNRDHETSSQHKKKLSTSSSSSSTTSTASTTSASSSSSTTTATTGMTKTVINTTRSIGARLYRPSSSSSSASSAASTAAASLTKKPHIVEHAIPLVNATRTIHHQHHHAHHHQISSNRSTTSTSTTASSSTFSMVRNIHTSKNMLVEFENLDGLRKLGVIVSSGSTTTTATATALSSMMSNSETATTVKTINSVIENQQQQQQHQSSNNSNNNNNNKWKLIDSTGKSTIIDSSQLTYQWPLNEMDKSSHTVIGEEYVKELETQCLTMAQQQQDKAENVWKEFLSGRTAIQVTCEDIAEHLFHSQSAVSLYAAHKFLYSNPLYFSCVYHNGKARFECRSIREVENLKKIQGEERRALVEEKKFLIKMANTLIALEPHNQRFYSSVKFDALQAIRIWEQDFTDLSSDLSQEISEDSKLVKALKTLCLKQYPLASTSTTAYERLLKPFAVYNSEASIMEFCLKLKLFDTPNIHLLRSSVNRSGFPPVVQMIADQMLKDPGPDMDVKYRRDLTHLRVFTIDSYPETVEIDDGVSLEIGEDGSETLYVHIADATRFMSYGGEVDKYASDTATSVYLPDKKIPMLPKELSTDVMSLSDARLNYVLTFKAKLQSNGELIEYDVFPAIVNKVKKIDYDEADQILANITSAEQVTYESLKRLMALANTRLRYRMKNGAFVSYSTPKPEIKVKANGIIEVARSKETSYSRRMIQECMIIANEVSAKFASERGILIPFRATMGGLGGGSGVIVDQPSDEDIENTINMITNPTESQLVAQIINNHESYKPVFGACVTQTASWHNGIGVSAYTQATSPIRRYSDLLVHYQLKAGIRGDAPPLSWEDMEQLLANLESTSKLVGSLQRKSERFWLFKYFQENMKQDKQYKALVLETKTDSSVSMRGAIGFIYLMEVGFKANMYMTKKANKGDMIYVRVSQCDPFAGTIEFQ